jgi:peptidoglycan/LPS O-acetylase OafA/YrhL
MVALQALGNIGSLLTGGALVLLLSLAVLGLVLRPRRRGWVVGAGLLAGVGLFVQPWSLFVAQQTRAAGADAGIWSWTLMVVGLLALTTAAWLLADLPRVRLAVNRAEVTSLAGGVTLVAGLAAVAVASAAVVSGRSLALAAAFLVGALVLLRTLRLAEPARHLGDLSVATGLLACLVWWVFVGTLQGATGGLGMIAIVILVFLATLTRAARAADAFPPTTAGTDPV